jgi:Holliday junction resolvase-like predicted endonuclease
MNKTAIKIIKRKDVEAAVELKTQNTGETNLAAVRNRKNFERRLHRKIAHTVSNWIAKRRESNGQKRIPQ